MPNELTPAATIEQIEAAAPAPPSPPTPFPRDNTATWTYWAATDTAERGISTEWVLERLRHHRDALLAASDFRTITDAPWDTAPWVSYRQALRDLPDTTDDPRQAVWPRPPH